jgi:hypothetical protein
VSAGCELAWLAAAVSAAAGIVTFTKGRRVKKIEKESLVRRVRRE